MFSVIESYFQAKSKVTEVAIFNNYLTVSLQVVPDLVFFQAFPKIILSFCRHPFFHLSLTSITFKLIHIFILK